MTVALVLGVVFAAVAVVGGLVFTMLWAVGELEARTRSWEDSS